MANKQMTLIFAGDSSQLSRTFSKLGAETDTFAGKMQNLGNGMANVGKNMTRAITLPIAGFGALALKEAGEAAKATAQTEAVIKSTGGSANVTTKQIKGLSDELGRVAGVEGEVVQEGANMLLTFTNVRNEAGKGNDIFNRSTKALIDMSTAMGTEPKQAAIQLGKALNDPIKGMTSLGRAGVQFTQQQKDQIKTLVESGDTLGAQKVILKELETQFGGSAKAAGDNRDPLEKLALAGKDLAEAIGTVILPIVTQWADKLGALAAKFQGLSPEMQKTIITVLAVAAAVGPLLFIAGKLITVFSQVGTAFTVLSKLFMANPWMLLIAAIIGLVVVVVKNWDTIKSAIGSAWEWIKNTTKTVWDGIKAGLQAVWDGIKLLFSLTPVGAIITHWNTIKNFTIAVWNSVRDFLSGVWNGIKSTASSAWNGVKDFIVGAWDRIKSGVSEKVGSLLDLVRGIPGRIKNSLGNVGDILLNAGKDVVRGMWDGISSMGGWLKDKLWDWIKRVLPGPVKAALGIASPSKVFAKIGQEIPRGLAQGIVGGTSTVSSAVNRMMGAASVPAFGGMTGGAMAGRSGGAGVVVNINGPVYGADAAQLAAGLVRPIHSELLKLQRSGTLGLT